MHAKLKMNSWLIGLALIGLVFCGCSDTPEAAKTTPEAGKATPQSAKPTTKEPVAKTLTSGNAKSDSTKKKGKKPTTPAKPIDAVKFPKPENAEKSIYNSETSLVMFHQVGNVEDQAKFYVEELGKLGWEKAPSSEISDGVGFFDFTNGALAITVTINPRDDKITTMAQGSGISVPKSLDDNGEDGGFEGDDDGEGDDDN